MVPDLLRSIPSVVEPLRQEVRRAVLADKRRAPHLPRSSSWSRPTCSGSWPTACSPGRRASGPSTTSTTAAWLRGHGIDPAALDSPILRGMYDLVFGYEGGDPARPRFSAGLGLQLATKMLLGYSGALFWKMQAGMGEVIFAPLYEVLTNRGVEFRFFHRVDALRLTDDGRSIAAIELGVQAELAEGVDAYDPLIRVEGPAVLAERPAPRPTPRHRAWSRGWTSSRSGRPDGTSGHRTLRGGDGLRRRGVRHLPRHGAARLRRSARPRSRPGGRWSTSVGTVATQSLQLWLSEDERRARLAGPRRGHAQRVRQAVRHLGVHVRTSCRSRTGPRRTHPGRSPTSAVPWPHPTLGPGAGRRAGRRAPCADRARRFLDRDVADAVAGRGGQRRLPLGPALRRDAAAVGPERLDRQYWRANIDPSDLYVQSLPGTDQYRLQPGSHRVRQPRRGRRLDGQRTERRMRRGSHPIRAAGRAGGGGGAARSPSIGGIRPWTMTAAGPGRLRRRRRGGGPVGQGGAGPGLRGRQDGGRAVRRDLSPTTAPRS